MYRLMWALRCISVLLLSVDIDARYVKNMPLGAVTLHMTSSSGVWAAPIWLLT